MKQGFIVKIVSNSYDVFDGEKIITTKARGKFRIGKYYPIVGDDVMFDEHNLLITDILPRTNQMTRPSLCNVDKVFIVASLSKPKIPLTLILRYIILSEMVGIKPSIILTKKDLCDDSYDDELIEKIKLLNYDYFLVSIKNNVGITDILKDIKNTKVVFAGQSGVGKSSLINCLIPGSKQQVQEISDALHRGKHTTRVVEYLKGKDFWIADTPGFSSIEFDLSVDDILRFYPGIKEYYGLCKFNDCTHDHEVGCKVKVDLENNKINKELYDDYIKLLNEIKSRKEY